MSANDVSRRLGILLLLAGVSGCGVIEARERTRSWGEWQAEGAEQVAARPQPLTGLWEFELGNVRELWVLVQSGSSLFAQPVWRRGVQRYTHWCGIEDEEGWELEGHGTWIDYSLRLDASGRSGAFVKRVPAPPAKPVELAPGASLKSAVLVSVAAGLASPEGHSEHGRLRRLEGFFEKSPIRVD